MQDLFNNDYMAVIVPLFVVLYGLNLAKMGLPHYVQNLFKNTIFKIVFLSLLLVYRFEKSPHIALAVALVFVLTLNYIGEQETKENFEYLEAFRNQS